MKKGKKYYLNRILNFNKDEKIFSDDYLKLLESPTKIKEFWNVLNLTLWNETRK